MNYLSFCYFNFRDSGPRHSSEGDRNMMQRPAVTVYANYLLANTHTPSLRGQHPPWVPQLGIPSFNQPSTFLPA